MIDYLGMVREFHEKYGHYIGKLNKTPPEEVIVLRHKLISEESDEFYDASDMLLNDPEELFTSITPLIADAIADLLYVVFGAALAYGIPIDAVFAEVHRSNMTKSMEKDTKSIKGKTIKGPNWEPPKIKEILDEYR